MAIQESGEMYLETVLRLSKKTGTVRSTDVAVEMGFSKPSVSRAVRILKTEGYLQMDADGSLSLTESGRKVAETIYDRHILLTNFLIKMGVDPETATEDACKMEHVISAQTCAAIKEYAKKM